MSPPPKTKELFFKLQLNNRVLGTDKANWHCKGEGTETPCFEALQRPVVFIRVRTSRVCFPRGVYFHKRGDARSRVPLQDSEQPSCFTAT